MKFAPLIFLFALFGSCFNPGDCLISATNLMHIQFKKKLSPTLDTMVIFSYQSISVSGTDSILRVGSPTAELLLPVDIHNDTARFIFHRINSDSTVMGTDTFQVTYTRQSKVISPDCGAYTYYQNLKILNTNLNSSQIKSFSTNLIKDPTNSVISAYAVNFQIFY